MDLCCVLESFFIGFIQFYFTLILKFKNLCSLTLSHKISFISKKGEIIKKSNYFFLSKKFKKSLNLLKENEKKKNSLIFGLKSFLLLLQFNCG